MSNAWVLLLLLGFGIVITVRRSAGSSVQILILFAVVVSLLVIGVSLSC